MTFLDVTPTQHHKKSVKTKDAPKIIYDNSRAINITDTLLALHNMLIVSHSVLIRFHNPSRASTATAA